MLIKIDSRVPPKNGVNTISFGISKVRYVVQSLSKACLINKNVALCRRMRFPSNSAALYATD